MRYDPSWMNHDERTPEQIARDRLRYLRDQETELNRRLEKVRDDMRALTAGVRTDG